MELPAAPRKGTGKEGNPVGRRRGRPWKRTTARSSVGLSGKKPGGMEKYWFFLTRGPAGEGGRSRSTRGEPQRTQKRAIWSGPAWGRPIIAGKEGNRVVTGRTGQAPRERGGDFPPVLPGFAARRLSTAQMASLTGEKTGAPGCFGGGSDSGRPSPRVGPAGGGLLGRSSPSPSLEPELPPRDLGFRLPPFCSADGEAARDLPSASLPAFLGVGSPQISLPAIPVTAHPAPG